MSLRANMKYMNPYDIHKALINEYVLRKPGDTKRLKRDTSRDRTDYDVIRENHRFLWEEDQVPESWESQFAKRYYDKLFKEYCIGDLSRYKENKIALRWRTENEVVVGKGQFTCGNKKCSSEEGLRTWEVNFAYNEQGEKKNALVKIRLCASCSEKLNYRTKKREVKRIHRRKHRQSGSKKGETESECVSSSENTAGSSLDSIEGNGDDKIQHSEESPWENLKPVEVKTRDEEMEEYLQDLLL